MSLKNSIKRMCGKMQRMSIWIVACAILIASFPYAIFAQSGGAGATGNQAPQYT